MARISAFKGILYNLKKISNLSSVLAPPYDVISPQEQEKLYNLSPYNIIRLTLCKDFPNDNETSNKYTRAAKYFQQWLDEGILIQDKRPALYVYQQEYLCKKEVIKRTGFICLLELADYSSGIVLPHEKTYSKPKEDRLALLRACKANFSQIFCLYEDPTGKITETLNYITSSPCYLEAKYENINNKIWKLTDKRKINEIVEVIKDKKLLIADGHHRYEVGLLYRKEVEKNQQEISKNANYTMAMFIDINDPGLIVLPTHRLIKNVKDLDKKLEDLKTIFFEEEINLETTTLKWIQNQIEERNKQDKIVFGLYCNRRFRFLNLRNEIDLKKTIKEEAPISWKKANVVVLQKLVFEKILGLKESHESYIGYTKDEEEAINLVDNGKFQAAFLLSALKPKDIKKIAEEGGILPQKSTYFYPKLFSGLVINKL